MTVVAMVRSASIGRIFPLSSFNHTCTTCGGSRFRHRRLPIASDVRQLRRELDRFLGRPSSFRLRRGRWRRSTIRVGAANLLIC
jgi:hypothetical protein